MASGGEDWFTMDYVNENRVVIDTASPKSSVKKEVWDKVRYLGPVPGVLV